MVNNENRGNPKTDLVYRRKKNAEDMRYQVISFGLMIGLTVVAFLTVASDLRCMVYGSVYPSACGDSGGVSAVLFYAHEPARA